VIDDTVEERLDALEATVAELREDLRVLVNRDVPLLKGTVRAIVDEEIESAEEFPDVGRAFGRRSWIFTPCPASRAAAERACSR
jgi:hypothetical protein